MSGQSFAINEDEGSANCGVCYLVSQLMVIVGLGEVKLSVTPSAADDDDEADDDDVDDIYIMVECIYAVSMSQKSLLSSGHQLDC